MASPHVTYEYIGVSILRSILKLEKYPVLIFSFSMCAVYVYTYDTV